MHGLNETTRKRQSESGADATRSISESLERREDRVLLSCRDAWPLIHNSNLNVVVDLASSDARRLRRSRESQRVVDQVGYDTLQ